MLTKYEIDNAKLADGINQRKIADGAGLYLLIKMSGAKCWRFDYAFKGKRKTLALGTYPAVSAAQARIALSEARKSLLNKTDPGATKKEEKCAEAVIHSGSSFSEVANEWANVKEGALADSTNRKIRECIDLLADRLGKQSINELRTRHFVEALQEIEKHTPHMAVKSLQNATSIIRYAIQRGYREEGLFIDLKGVLKPIKESHFPSPTEENNLSQVSKIMKSVLLYKKKNIVVGSALNLLLYTFARPIELVCMRWEEIIEKGTEWHYLVSKNDNQKHIVPLSKQAQNILKELKPITGDKEFVFSSTYAKAGHIHRDTLSKAFRDMGFRDVIVPHGSRHLASTTLNEMKFRSDVIEIQLSHRDSSVRGIYNHARWLPERHEMMQKWSDHLDQQTKKSAKTIKKST